jgi:Ca2+-binding RTX toxin-like protein
LLAAAVSLACLLAAGALADADVSIDGNDRLIVAVRSVAGADGNHGIVLEPIRDAFRPNGFRVSQDGFGRPAFRSSDGECFVNGVINNVVCDSGGRRAAAVTGGDGDDIVAAVETQGRSLTMVVTFAGRTFSFPVGEGAVDTPADVLCGTTPQPILPVSADLGSGDDVLLYARARNPCPAGRFPRTGARWSITASGGSGEDVMLGGDHADTLSGGNQRDTLEGGGGDDTLDGGAGPDVLSGGQGFDTVTYAGRTSGVQVTLDGVANDGQGEGDNVRPNVERVLGGSGNDTITANDLANTLVGNAGAESLNGRGGDDVLLGGPGGDELSGGEGTDRFDGGEGNDFIQSRDGVFEAVSCGDGNDSVIGDLADFFVDGIPPLRNRNGRDCEFTDVFAIDDGPPGHVANRPLRRRADRTVVVDVVCPRTARIACSGALTLRRASGSGVLASGRYRAALGRTVSVSLSLRTGLPSRVRAETLEQGVSKKGARSSSYLLLVR